jgi:hypothetical protein
LNPALICDVIFCSTTNNWSAGVSISVTSRRYYASVCGCQAASLILKKNINESFEEMLGSVFCSISSFWRQILVLLFLSFQICFLHAQKMLEGLPLYWLFEIADSDH